MAYLSATELHSTLPKAVPTFTGSSAPLTLDDVAQILDRFSFEVDGAAAAAGYSVPILAPSDGGASSAYQQVRQAVTYGAGWQVLRVLLPDQGGPANKSSLAAEYKAAYDAAIKSIRKGETPLIGAGTSAGGAGRELPRSWWTSNSVATAALDMDIVY